MSLVFTQYKNELRKTLQFNNIRLNKKEFHKSNQPIDLMSVNTKHIVTSDKFKHSGDVFKYIIDYQENEIEYYLTSNEWMQKIFWKRWRKHVFHG